MRRSMVLRATLILCFFVSLITPFSGLADAAATTTPASSGSTDTIKISPVESNVTINAGTSSVVKTYVTNVTSAPISLEPIENDFIAGGGDDGTPYIVLGANSYAPTHSLKRFMLPLSNVTVQPGERKEVDVTISVPKTAQAGGYYGAVRFAPASENADESVNLQTSAASLILLTVPGALVEKLNVTDFEVRQNGSTGGSFRTAKNLDLYMKFQNAGNINVSPYGQIYVKKGTKVVYTDNFNQNQPQQTILPDSSRQWSIPLKHIGSFGKYEVGATLTYGSQGQTIDIVKTIWIVPLAYIIGGVIAIIVIIVLIALIWRILMRAHRRRSHKNSRRRY
jgi:hypothetical protein